MFVEEKAAGEETPAKVGTLRLSEAIRIGCKLVPENRTFCGCAMGAAYYVLTGRNLEDDQSKGYGNGESIIAELTGVPRHIVVKASRDHYNGRATREQAADWLESQGY